VPSPCLLSAAALCPAGVCVLRFWFRMRCARLTRQLSLAWRSWFGGFCWLDVGMVVRAPGGLGCVRAVQCLLRPWSLEIPEAMLRLLIKAAWFTWDVLGP